MLYFVVVEFEGSLEFDRVVFKFVCLLERYIIWLNIVDFDWCLRIFVGIEYVEWNWVYGFMVIYLRVVYYVDLY